MSSASVDPARAAESNLGRILGINTSFHVLALIFVGLRTYTRLAVVRSFGRDDLMILIAIACAFFGGMITYIIAAYHGLGRHANTISDEDYKEYLRMTFIQAIVSTIGALAFLKLSVGFALLRLNQSRRYTQVIWAMIGFVCLYTTVSWIEWFVYCKPISGFWDKSDGATCLPSSTHKGFALMNTACNILTDIVFATLPVPIIWRLQMALRTRAYLVTILSLGYIAVLLGVVKAVFQNVFRGDTDQSFTNWIQFWGFMQVNVGIMAACAPSLKPLVGGVLNLSSAGKYSGSTHRYGPYSDKRVPGRMPVGSVGTNKGWIKTNSQTDGFEMDSHLVSDSEAPKGRHVTRVMAGSRSGRENDIYRGRRLQTIGVVRTVDVSVT